jgi:hypothetical protein
LHESQSNRKDNSEDYQENIKGRLTLTTPTNCKENSEENTQSSQKGFKVDIHLLLSQIIFHLHVV